MDLNKPPPDFDFDFLDGEFDASNPPFCTQPAATHLIEPTISEVRLSLEQAMLQDIEHVSTHQTVDATDNNQDGSSGHQEASNTYHGAIDQVHCVDDVVEEEVWSTPPVPYNGQSVARKEEARAFCNAYAKRICFSIRTNTSRLSAMPTAVFAAMVRRFLCA